MVIGEKMGEKNGDFYGRKKWQHFLFSDDGIPKMVIYGSNNEHFRIKNQKLNFLEIF